MCICRVQTSQMASYNHGCNAVLQFFSSSPVFQRVLGPIMPYLHLQCKFARDTSPPSNRYLTLPEAVRDRASIRRIGLCSPPWP